MKWIKIIGITLIGVIALLVGAAIIYHEIRKEPYILTIKNNSSSDIENITLKGQGFGHKESLGRILSGDQIQYSFYVRGEGPLEFEVTWNEKSHSGVIEGYVSGGFGGNGKLIFNQDGTIVIKSTHEKSI